MLTVIKEKFHGSVAISKDIQFVVLDRLITVEISVDPQLSVQISFSFHSRQALHSERSHQLFT